MKKLIEVQNLEKQYGTGASQTKALAGVDMTIREGEFTGIMGASGSGKTTLLNMLALIDRPSAGSIRFGQAELAKFNEEQVAQFRKANLGFIFQDFNLLDTLTLEENVRLALDLAGVSSKQAKTKTAAMLKTLGIAEMAKKFPNQVSGGQKQRCACARALITEPKLILADEPTGALDSNSSTMLLDTLATMNQQLAATILMVTHDAYSASYCDRILYLADGMISHELRRDGRSQREFFFEILDVMASSTVTESL